jgi:RNA polymerase sigma-70 factor (ECF subfamily)
VDEPPEVLLEQARAGDVAARGRLLELYRNYLRLLARSLIGSAIQVRLEPSDLVQETFLEAHRDLGSFTGRTEAELLVWLRRIMVRNAMDQAKRHGAQRRDVRHQESLEVLLDRSGQEAHEALASRLSTPSARAARREQAVLLADALARLPADYREVLVLRHMEHRKFGEIAIRMGRSSGAVRMLWTRALERLHRELENPS